MAARRRHGDGEVAKRCRCACPELFFMLCLGTAESCRGMDVVTKAATPQVTRADSLNELGVRLHFLEVKANKI